MSTLLYKCQLKRDLIINSENLSNINSMVYQNLEKSIYKYDEENDVILIEYGDVKFAKRKYRIVDDNNYIVAKFSFSAYYFKPEYNKPLFANIVELTENTINLNFYGFCSGIIQFNNDNSKMINNTLNRMKTVEVSRNKKYILLTRTHIKLYKNKNIYISYGSIEEEYKINDIVKCEFMNNPFRKMKLYTINFIHGKNNLEFSISSENQSDIETWFKLIKFLMNSSFL